MPLLRLAPAKTNRREGDRLRVITSGHDSLAVQALVAHRARTGAPARRTVVFQVNHGAGDGPKIRLMVSPYFGVPSPRRN
jgi:hypothetical protein